MSDSTRDRIEGAVDKATGSGKSAVGDLTDNERMQGEGEVDQTKGDFKQGKADVKDKVGDMVKKVTN